jgi:hypothetical protein
MVVKLLVSPLSPATALDVLATGSGDTTARRETMGERATGGVSAPRPDGVRASLALCPNCGSVLDAPRRGPDSGRVARKCMVCEQWHSPPGLGRRALAV